MTLSKKIIIVSFIIAVSGFIHAALSSDRSLGIAIFLTGFFLACGTTVITVLATPSHIFGGKMGVGVKIMIAGFGLIAFGELIQIVFKINDFGDYSYNAGMIVMIVGIVVAAFKRVE